MARSSPRLLRIARVRFRRTARKLDFETPEWMRWLTPWGTSLALHALMLLLLAVLVNVMGHDESKGEFPKIVGQLSDDVTSLHPADRAGDPFTTLKSDEPPSLSLEVNPLPSVEIRVPKLPDSYVMGPAVNNMSKEPAELTLPKEPSQPSKQPGRLAASAKAMTEGAGVFDARLPLMAPFSGRSAEGRAKMVRREGGTVESEKAVELGLDWIARHQRPDGAWSLDTNPYCKGAPCPDAASMITDTGATGLALLPLLGAGHTHTSPGRYQKTLERGLFWLVKMQKPTGELFTGGGNHTLFYSHAIATMALCEAYGITKDKRLRDPAQRAIFYINRTQNRSDGGWRYVVNQDSDTSVFGWQVFAMRSAHLAGLEVNKAVLRRSREYLDRAVSDPSLATYCYMPGRPQSPSMTAEALVCRQLLGWPRDHPAMLAGTAAIAEHLEASQERNIYYWYYATQLLHNMHGKTWEHWNARVREGLIGMQAAGEGCDRGSWDPNSPQIDRWGLMGGRLYTTSLSLLTLEVYYRYLPLYRDQGGEMAGADRDPDEAPRPAMAGPAK
ncbi:MAG: hypothetical protein JWN86_2389 [Planctomycetota bacterium]|nr:hypothetical protein [Planctomycetota bacterium]